MDLLLSPSLAFGGTRRLRNRRRREGDREEGKEARAEEGKGGIPVRAPRGRQK